MKGNSSVLDFWKSRKESDPELYGLSNICFAIPPTQIRMYAIKLFNIIVKFVHSNKNVSKKIGKRLIPKLKFFLLVFVTDFSKIF